MTAPTFDKISK